MRRKIPYRVCRCMPNGVVTQLETRLLIKLVNREIHPIRCAESCRRKYQKGMRIGELCAETGHYWWAIKIWQFTASLIEAKDYNDWCHVTFDNRRVRLRDVISETECELLDRRCSDLWFRLGHPELSQWDEQREQLATHYFGTRYHDLFADKYEGYYDHPVAEYEKEIAEALALQQTDQLFRDALGDE